MQLTKLGQKLRETSLPGKALLAISASQLVAAIAFATGGMVVEQFSTLGVVLTAVFLLGLFAFSIVWAFLIPSSDAYRGFSKRSIFNFAMLSSFASVSLISAQFTLSSHNVANPPPMTTNAPPMLPDFPWPPPTPSSRWSIPRDQIIAGTNLTVLADYDRLLCGELAKARYSSLSYFSVPGGFALVTQIECIEEDGCPLPDPKRWNVNAPLGLTRLDGHLGGAVRIWVLV